MAAKFSSIKREKLIEQAKSLYLKDFSIETISQILNVSASTIKKWVNQYDFEKSKKNQLIALSQIRRSILESYADMLEGREPRIKPDQAAKYAAAFEKFSARKQVLIYMYEAFEMLTDQYQKNVEQAATKQEKEEAMRDLQNLRKNMDIVIKNLQDEILGQ
ncbi:MAG: terminase gpP N-terminus-related DNA-binding protein [Thermaurantimonas sp.]|uniref:terminase gpP N-terminus-related DNA-binding protein n=1 Tax=Thermaurantimonas TaxID=2681566 RepID=UPI0023F3D9EC|nr:hypothetical protein [Thermaurantimonas aggregans]MCX8149224.1 hypothetical protein [Thermaurantimonas aggregans]